MKIKTVKTMLKKQPTVVNGYWVMTWIDGGYVWTRDMSLLETIRYFPRMILRALTSCYKFPKI